jgi:RNA recognition motif-containing protein
MAKKIYVGNMNYNTSEEDLRALFEEFGEVRSVSIVTDRYTGQSKGFAFVEMEEDGAASSAIAALNSRELDGRQLRVNEAHDKPQQPRREFRRY